MECVAINVATAAFLAQCGYYEAPPYLLNVQRNDGEDQHIAVATLARCAELVATLRPASLTVYCSIDEDAHALARAVLLNSIH